MAASPDVNRVRFARFVARALADARDRGLTDRKIHEITGIPPATFHRWRAAKFVTAPDLDKVKRFCAGLGIPANAAMLALGIAEGRDDPEPEPALDPDVRRILRALADPHVSDQDKLVIREMLRMLARRVGQPNHTISE